MPAAAVMSPAGVMGPNVLPCGSLRAAAHSSQGQVPHSQAPSHRNLAVSDFSYFCFAAGKQEEQDNLEDFITWDSFLLLLCSWQCTNY